MARSAMKHRAVIERNTATDTDPDGQPVAPSWEPWLQLPCRAYTKMRKEVLDGDKTAMVEDLKALFSLESEADLSEDCRIENILDRRGTVLFAGPIDILTIQRRDNHLETSLDRIQS